MTEKVKDKLIVSVFSFLLSVAVFVLGFWLTGMRVSDEALDKRIDAKVDKIQYDKDCLATEAKMEIMNQTIREHKKTQEEFIMLLYKIDSRLASMETDITWIKKNK
jgi:hypothetical protein